MAFAKSKEDDRLTTESLFIKKINLTGLFILSLGQRFPSTSEN